MGTIWRALKASSLLTRQCSRPTNNDNDDDDDDLSENENGFRNKNESESDKLIF